ncbi:MAG: hypothetical protein KC978_17370 [Candidatus Omnitrophica bacterium]|nr:hypothetical protein [Candidatus Omnitrophota bacterium]
MKVIAHRGDSFHCPENTLASFRSAADKGADYVELDSRVTKDGVLVCNHDGSLEKKTNVAEILGSTDYTIESVTFEVTQKLDVGSWKGPKFKGEKIPTLEDALKTIQKGSVTLLERKTGSALDHAKLLERMGLVEDLIVQSFDWDFLAAMRTWLPEAKLAALSGKEVTEEKLNDIQRLGIDIAVWRHSDLTPQNFPMFAKHGLEVWVYTVDEPADWKRMVDLGVTGLITDKPAELRKWLQENGYE